MELHFKLSLQIAEKRRANKQAAEEEDEDDTATGKLKLARLLLRRRNGCDNGTEAGGDVIVELKSQL